MFYSHVILCALLEYAEQHLPPCTLCRYVCENHWHTFLLLQELSALHMNLGCKRTPSELNQSPV